MTWISSPLKLIAPNVDSQDNFLYRFLSKSGPSTRSRPRINAPLFFFLSYRCRVFFHSRYSSHYILSSITRKWFAQLSPPSITQLCCFFGLKILIFVSVAVKHAKSLGLSVVGISDKVRRPKTRGQNSTHTCLTSCSLCCIEKALERSIFASKRFSKYFDPSAQMKPETTQLPLFCAFLNRSFICFRLS